MKTSHQYYRVDRRQINLIRFIFEAYEGVAVVTTLDAAKGLIGLAVGAGCETMVKDIVHDLSRTIRIEVMDSPAPEFENFY